MSVYHVCAMSEGARRGGLNPPELATIEVLGVEAGLSRGAVMHRNSLSHLSGFCAFFHLAKVRHLGNPVLEIHVLKILSTLIPLLTDYMAVIIRVLRAGGRCLTNVISQREM